MTSRGRVAELRNAARQTLRPELAPPRRLGTICRFSNEIFSAMLVISIQSKYRYQRCFRLLHGLLRPKIKHVLSLPQPSLLRPGLVTSFAKPNQYGTKIQPLFSCGDKAQSPQLSVQISTVCAINVFCVESYLLDTGHYSLKRRFSRGSRRFHNHGEGRLVAYNFDIDVHLRH